MWTGPSLLGYTSLTLFYYSYLVYKATYPDTPPIHNMAEKNKMEDTFHQEVLKKLRSYRSRFNRLLSVE